MSLAYFPLYPDDFEADTAHLTLAEDGAYNRLLRLCWRTPGCSLPADRAWIHRRMRAISDDDKAVVDAVLDEFFTVSDGRLSNARLAREWLEANRAHKRRSAAGKKGGLSKALKAKENESGNAKAMLKQPEPEPEPYIDKESDDSLLMPRKRGRTTRGTRLSADWTLPDDWRTWAVSTLGMAPHTVAIEADKFRDHWTAKAGKDACKLDWQATWRNWCRNSGPRGSPQSPAVTPFPRIRARFPDGYQ